MLHFPLGRVEPADDRHLQKYHLSAATMPSQPTPVVLGINWYTGFDRPELLDGAYWIGRTGLGTVRGGHAICARPALVKDHRNAYHHYDQGTEGACVGFSSSRMMSLLNRRLYDGFALYKAAQGIDEFPGENYDGTTVRAGMDVLRTTGPYRIRKGETVGPVLADGIIENRWATTVEEICACLGQDLNLGYIILLNSWGTGYPQEVRMDLGVLRRLMSEHGEATLVTDRPGRSGT